MRKLAALLLLVCVVPAYALRAAPRVKHRKHRQHQPTWFDYRAFPPTHESLYQQNEAIDKMGLPRIKDSKALVALEDNNELVPITANRYVRISPKLEADRRYARPFVDAFLQELGKEYFDRFEDSLQVNSAVRTMKTQMRLLRWNHNAAPVHGDKASAHLAGVAVDLQRRGLTQTQVRFIQQKLDFYVRMGMVIVEEELKQPCFHIVVTGEYVPPVESKPDLKLLKEVPNGNHDFATPLDCPVDHVWTGAEIQTLLDNSVRYKDWKFVVQQEDINRNASWDIDLHLRAEWLAPDNVTGAMEKQSSRWWRLSKHMRKNEIINTAFACVKMAEEHEMRENFLYRLGENWTMPYNTHTDVDELAAASVVVDVRIDPRKEAPKNQRRD